MLRFARVGAQGHERPVVIDHDRAYDLRPLTHDVDGSFLATAWVDRVQQALRDGALPSTSIEGERGRSCRTPLSRGVHRSELRRARRRVRCAHADRPDRFLKTPNTVVGPHDDIRLPAGSRRTAWEVELGVVIGRRAERIASTEDAAHHVAGYVVSNDVSERELQLEASGGQWSKGKCCPTFNPLGPWLVPASEVADVQDLRLSSWVNGEPRQSSTTADMVFGVHCLIRELSQFLTLEPGDLVNTGTPEGVAVSGRFPFLAEGDVVEVGIDGLGRQRTRVIT